jgi:hypothetical protein
MELRTRLQILVYKMTRLYNFTAFKNGIANPSIMEFAI